MDNVQSWPTQRKKRRKKGTSTRKRTILGPISSFYLYFLCERRPKNMLRCACVCVHSHWPPSPFLFSFSFGRPNDWRSARTHTSDSHPDNGRLTASPQSGMHTHGRPSRMCESLHFFLIHFLFTFSLSRERCGRESVGSENEKKMEKEVARSYCRLDAQYKI